MDLEGKANRQDLSSQKMPSRPSNHYRVCRVTQGVRKRRKIC